MKKIMFIIFLVSIIGCSSKNITIGKIDTKKSNIEIAVSFNSESYPWLLGTKYPQMAIWIKDKNSPLTKTIFITEKGGKSDWFGADKRPSSIPVWYGILKEEKKNGKMKLDAVSGATPSGETAVIRWQVTNEFKDKDVEIFIEANVSFDYNKSYPKKAKEGSSSFSDVNGQPSVVWKGELKMSDSAVKIKPVLIGHGQVLGKDHKIYSKMETITTAKTLFSYIECKYSPGVK